MLQRQAGDWERLLIIYTGSLEARRKIVFEKRV
jgi:hypothetical protein